MTRIAKRGAFRCNVCFRWPNTPPSLLKARGETVAVAESSTAGLISAALVAVPGASAYFVGGGVIYTAAAQRGLLDIPREQLRGIRASTEPYARLGAQTIRTRLATHLGNRRNRRHGTDRQSIRRRGRPQLHRGRSDPCERSITLETGRSDRVDNMWAFSEAALQLFVDCLTRPTRGNLCLGTGIREMS